MDTTNFTHLLTFLIKTNKQFSLNTFTRKWKSMILVIACIPVLNNTAYSIPSYARQTGRSCSECHNTFPQLTPFGREFKLNGYTLTETPTIDSQNDKGRTFLKLLASAPFSAMVQTSFTSVNKELPETQNNNVEFPQQLSLFYAGMIAPHLGSFIQMTYSGQDGTIGMDNAELRYANSTLLGEKKLTYGITLNNNPTVQDLYNTVPAWRFPFASSATAPSPSAATLLEGALSQQVAGLGAYAFFNNLIYAEFSLYRSAQQGAHNPPDSTVSMLLRGAAPYWRLALQQNWGKNFLELGTIGMTGNFYPAGTLGKTDRYSDMGLDLQYEYYFPKSSFIIHSSYIYEKQKLNKTLEILGSDNKIITLNSFKIDLGINYKKGFAATLGYFSVNGNSNPYLYSGPYQKPNSDGYIAEIAYLPWYNTKFALQYVMYDKFDGGKSNYDDSGRNASNNNAIYLSAWVSF